MRRPHPLIMMRARMWNSNLFSPAELLLNDFFFKAFKDIFMHHMLFCQIRDQTVGQGTVMRSIVNHVQVGIRCSCKFLQKIDARYVCSTNLSVIFSHIETMCNFWAEERSVSGGIVVSLTILHAGDTGSNSVGGATYYQGH